MKRLLAAASMVALTWSGGARAAEPLGFDDVVEAAMVNAKSVLSARAREDASSTLVGVADAAFMPTVRGSVSGALSYTNQPYLVDVRYDSTATVYSGALNARYPLFDFGARSRVKDSATAAASAAGFDSALARLDAALLGGSLYFAVVGDEERIQVAREQLERRRTQAEIVRALVKGGARPTVDQGRADIETESAQIAVTSAIAARNLDAAGLLGALGRDPAGEVALAPFDEGALAVDDAPERAARDAMKWYPTIARSRALVSQAEAARSAAGAARLPVLSLFGLVTGARTDIQAGTGLSGNSLAAAGGLMLEGSVLDATLSAKVHAADATIGVARSALDEELLRVRLDAVRAALQLEALNAALDDIAKRLALASTTLDAVRGRYQEGVAPMLEIVDAETTYAQARESDIRARQAVRVARLRLLLVTRGEGALRLGRAQRGTGAP